MSDNSSCCAVSAADFDTAVLERSRSEPVLVDFWAQWCQPCHMLAPVLEKLAAEMAGELAVAKVDVDADQALATQYGIRSLPTVVLFRDGAPVDQFSGVQPENVIRELLARHMPAGPKPAMAAAQAALASGDAEAAMTVLHTALESDPADLDARLALAALTQEMGDAARASELLDDVPLESSDDPRVRDIAARIMFALAVAEAGDLHALQQGVAARPDDHATRHQLGASLMLAGEYNAGMEQFLEIMRQDRQFQDRLAHRSLLAALDLSDNAPDDVRRVRRQIATLLN